MSQTYHNPVNGEYTSIIESADDTGGEYSLLEVRLNAGGRNPRHYHLRFTEEFEAVEGLLQLEANGKRILLAQGQRCSVAPRTTHLFMNPSEKSIVFRVRLYPGQPGFENFIKAAFGLINNGKAWKNQVPKNPLHAAVLLQWGDTHLTGYAFRLGTPLMKRLYRYASRSGVEQQLFEDYCRGSLLPDHETEAE